MRRLYTSRFTILLWTGMHKIGNPIWTRLLTITIEKCKSSMEGTCNRRQYRPRNAASTVLSIGRLFVKPNLAKIIHSRTKLPSPTPVLRIPCGKVGAWIRENYREVNQSRRLEIAIIKRCAFKGSLSFSRNKSIIDSLRFFVTMFIRLWEQQKRRGAAILSFDYGDINKAGG